MASPLTVKVIRKINEVRQSDWDRLLGQSTPFMRWDWLDALEQTGCVRERTGWLPRHILIEHNGVVIGACPMYLKLNSMGEFVFDYEWAEIARELGVQYYPKLLVGIPFTPVTGARFLTDGRAERREVIKLLGHVAIQVARENKISSVHVNFCVEDEAEPLEQIGFVRRTGLQFHWKNRGYQTFDDYLGAFRSDRRTKVRRERRELLQQGITIRALEGEELNDGHFATMFRLYKGHIDKLYYGRQYLTREFFNEVGRRFKPHVCLILAEKDSRIIAGTFNVQDDEALYGRYWGAFQEERYLHFNVCYYAAIEHCIRKGLRRFEAGAGGSFKQLRGLDPEPTTSMHFIVDGRLKRVIERYLRQEKGYVEEKQAGLMEKSQLKKSDL